MNIPDPWAGAYEDYKAARDDGGPAGTANQVIDVTAKFIGKRRSARDAAKNFLKNKARQAQQSAAGQKVAQVASNVAGSPFAETVANSAKRAAMLTPGGVPGLAALHGASTAIGYTLGRQQGYQNPTASGIFPTVAATFLAGPLTGIGYATGRYQGRKNAQRDEAAAVNPAAQMPLY